MSESRRELSLIVPVYHCAGNLRQTLDELARFLDDAGGRCEVVLVDDHGTDPSASLLLWEFARRDEIRLIRNDRNRGKGFSVKRGMLTATGRYRVFTDSDLAYPLREVWSMVDKLKAGA